MNGGNGKLKPPAKGSIETLELYPITLNPQHEGISVDVQHVGPRRKWEWDKRGQKLRLEEARRMHDQRKGTTKDSAPDLWGDNAMTPEGLDEFRSLLMDVFSETVTGLHGVEVDKTEDFLDYLDMPEMSKLFQSVVGVQSLRPQQIFTKGPGDVETERSPAA